MCVKNPSNFIILYAFAEKININNILLQHYQNSSVIFNVFAELSSFEYQVIKGLPVNDLHIIYKLHLECLLNLLGTSS